MPDNQQRPDQEENQDRSIPPVGGTRIDKDKLFWPLMAGVLVAAFIVMWGFGLFASDKQPEKIVKQQAVEYKREKITKFQIPKKKPSSSKKPAIVTATAAQPIEPAAGPTTVRSKQVSNKDRMSAEQRQKKLEKRWGAPLVIYDGLEKGGSQSDTSPHQQDQSARMAKLGQLQEQLLEKVDGAVSGQSKKAGLKTSAVASSKRITGYAKASYLSPDYRRYTLTEGTMISAVLETAIQSNLAGTLRASVDEDVYSHDGSTLIAEEGSTLIGEYQSGLKQGQARIFAIWNRMITPLGVNVELQSPGTDQLGRAGLSGWVDTHFWKRFGSSVMLSIIGAQTARTASDGETNSQAIAQSVSDNFNKSSEIALENSINISPTLHKNQGDLIKVFVARDINFKDAYMLSQQQGRVAVK